MSHILESCAANVQDAIECKTSLGLTMLSPTKVWISVLQQGTCGLLSSAVRFLIFDARLNLLSFPRADPQPTDPHSEQCQVSAHNN